MRRWSAAGTSSVCSKFTLYAGDGAPAAALRSVAPRPAGRTMRSCATGSSSSSELSELSGEAMAAASAQENEENAQSLSGCRSGAVTAALKSSAAASQAQRAVKKAQSESVSGSEGVWCPPRGALRQ